MECACLYRIVKLVRALRKGWIQRDKPAVDEDPKPYLLWADDGQATGKTATGLAYVPAPKPKLPGHEESYNPPKEYLPTEVSPRELSQQRQAYPLTCFSAHNSL